MTKRIVLATDGLSTGIGQHVQLLSLWLSRLGIENVVRTFSAGELGGFPPRAQVGHSQTDLLYSMLWNNIDFATLELKPSDVLNVHDLRLLPAAVMLQRKVPNRVIATLHSTPHEYLRQRGVIDDTGRYAQLLEATNDWACRSIANFVCLAPTQVEYLRSIANPRIWLIGNFLDPDLVPAMTNPNRSKQALYLGRLSAGKGILELVEYMAQTKELDWPQLTIAGDGPLKEKVDEVIARAELNCVTVGQLARSEALELMAQSSILIHPARWDVYPTTLLEAKARGVCIVTSDVGNVRDIVTHGETGYIFESLDDLAGLLPLLGSSNQVAAMGEQAREDIARHLAPQVVPRIAEALLAE